MNAMKELERLMKKNKDVLIRLKEGVENKGHVHCPANGWDCPYYDANGICMMYPDSNPLLECDDFYFFWEGSEEKDFVCFDKHEKEE